MNETHSISQNEPASISTRHNLMVALKRVSRDTSRLHLSITMAMQDLQDIDNHESRKRTSIGAHVSSSLPKYEPDLGTFQPPARQLMYSGENFQEWRAHMSSALTHYDYVNTGIRNDSLQFGVMEWIHVDEEIRQAIMVSVEPSIITSLGRIDTAPHLWASICEKFARYRAPSMMSDRTDSPTTERENRCLLLNVPAEILKHIISYTFTNSEEPENGALPSYHEKSDVMATCRTLYNFIQETDVLWRLLPTRGRKALLKKILSYNVRNALDVEFNTFRDDESLLLVIDEVKRWESLTLHEVRTENWEKMLHALLDHVLLPAQPIPNLKRLKIRNFCSGYKSEADAISVLRCVKWTSIQSLEIDGGPIPTDYPNFAALRQLTIHSPSERDVHAINSMVRMLQETPNLVSLHFRRRQYSSYDVDDDDDVTDVNDITDSGCATLQRLENMNIQLLYDGKNHKGVFTQLEMLSRKLITPALVSLTIAQELWVHNLEKETAENAVIQIARLFATRTDTVKVQVLSLSFLIPIKLKSDEESRRAKLLGILLVKYMLTRFETAKTVDIYMLDSIPITDVLARSTNAISLKLCSAEVTSYRHMDSVVQWLYQNKRKKPMSEEVHRKEASIDTDARRDENTLCIQTELMRARQRVPGQLPRRQQTKEQWAGSTWLIWESYE